MKRYGVWRKWNNSAESMYNHVANYDSFHDAEEAARSWRNLGETGWVSVVDNHDLSADPLLVLSFNEDGDVKSSGPMAPPSESWSYLDFMARVREELIESAAPGAYASPFARKHFEAARDQGEVYWRGLTTKVDNRRLKWLGIKREKHGYVFCNRLDTEEMR